MGRRSTHAPDELRRLVLDAAEKIIENDGLAGLSAREVARRVGYSPGTLYNIFEGLDDLILNVEARMLSALDERLATALAGECGADAVRRFAQSYLAFSRERPRLWNLLSEHHVPHSFTVPQWYQDKLEMPVARLETAIAPIVGTGDPVHVRRSARALWAGLHGVSSLSTTDKVGQVTIEAANELLDELVETYLAGLTQMRSR
jgi:AcrR family transcriptional regulator